MFRERGEASQAPTTMRQRRARQEGQFGKSHELVIATVWGGGLALLATLGGQLWTSLEALAEQAWGTYQLTASDHGLVQEQLLQTTPLLWRSWLPLLGLTACFAFVVHAIQTEFRWFPHRVIPRWDQMTPQSYLARVFSLDRLCYLAVGILKLAVLSATTYTVLYHDRYDLLMLSGQSLEGASTQGFEYLLGLGLKLSVAAILLGVLDYGMQRWLNYRQLKMTEQEVREEQRSMEPPEEIGARQRLLNQRYRARSDMSSSMHES